MPGAGRDLVVAARPVAREPVFDPVLVGLTAAHPAAYAGAVAILIVLAAAAAWIPARRAAGSNPTTILKA